MGRLPSVFVVPLIFVGGVYATSVYAATMRIGRVVVIERELEGVFSGQKWSKKFKGDDVHETEYVRTARESSARIGLVDKTDILIGPTATLRFDRITFKPNKIVERIAISAGSGAYRIVGGTSPAVVTTSTVSIHNDGTVYDLFVEDGRTTVVLREGRIKVCPLGPRRRCIRVRTRDHMIIGTAAKLEGPRRAPPAPEFANRCLSASSQSCIIVASRGQAAQPANNPTPAPYTTQSTTPQRPVVIEKPSAGERRVYPTYYGPAYRQRIYRQRIYYPPVYRRPPYQQPIYRGPIYQQRYPIRTYRKPARKPAYPRSYRPPRSG